MPDNFTVILPQLAQESKFDLYSIQFQLAQRDMSVTDNRERLEKDFIFTTYCTCT